MVRPDASAVAYDPEIDAPQTVRRRSALASAVMQTVLWAASGVWLGNVIVTAFVVFPVTVKALEAVLGASGRSSELGPLASLVYSYTASLTDPIDALCCVVLIANSIHEAFRGQPHRALRATTVLLYCTGLAMVLTDIDRQTELISAPFVKMSIFHTSGEWLALVEIVCIVAAMLCIEWVSYHDQADSG